MHHKGRENNRGSDLDHAVVRKNQGCGWSALPFIAWDKTMRWSQAACMDQQTHCLSKSLAPNAERIHITRGLLKSQRYHTIFTGWSWNK